MKLDANAVYERLERRYGMSLESFAKMVPHRRMFEWGGWVYAFSMDDATVEDFAAMRRLEACVAALDAGKSWDEALA